jgi:hypothetical protein
VVQLARLRLSLRGCDEIRTTDFQFVASARKPLLRDGLQVRRTAEQLPHFKKSQPLRESTLFRGAKGDNNLCADP